MSAVAALAGQEGASRSGRGSQGRTTTTHSKSTSISTASSWSRANERVSFFASSSPSTSSSTPTWSSSPSSTSTSPSEIYGGCSSVTVRMDSTQGLGISEGWHEIEGEPPAQHDAILGEAHADERVPGPSSSAGPSSVAHGSRSNDFCVRADPLLVFNSPAKKGTPAASPSRLRRVSSYLSVRGALDEAKRLIRQAVSSANSADRGSQSHYPPSPSLLRSHPSIRHGPSSTLSPRRAVRQAGVVVLLLVVLVVATHDLSRIRNSARAMRAYFDPSLSSSSNFSTAKAAHVLPLADADDDEDLLPFIESSPRDDFANADGSTNEASAKAQQVIDHAVEMAAKKRKAKNKKKKDASQYKRLLPLGAPPRRYRYGANFVVADDDAEAQITVKDPERTNGVIRVPSQKQLKRIHEIGRKRYLAEEADWRTYEWQAPPPHSSLIRFTDKLTPVSARFSTSSRGPVEADTKTCISLRRSWNFGSGFSCCRKGRHLGESVSERARTTHPTLSPSRRCQYSIAVTASSGQTSPRRQRVVTPANAKGRHGRKTTGRCMRRYVPAFVSRRMQRRR